MTGKGLALTFLTAFALAKTAQVFYDYKQNNENELINGLLQFDFTRFNDSSIDSFLIAKVRRPQGLRIMGITWSHVETNLLNKSS